MRTLAALLCLAPLAAPADVQLKVAADLPAGELVELLGKVTGVTCLYPPKDLEGRTSGGTYDFTVPQERLGDAADFLVRQCGLDLRLHAPVKVILPGSATETRFRASGLKTEIQFDRGPGGWLKPEDSVGSLSTATVEALLAEARGGHPGAVDVIAAMGPRTPPTAGALAGLLDDPRLRSRAAAALVQFGFASKPALPALREAAKADATLEAAVRAVDAARHPALLDPSLATGTAPQRFVVRFDTTEGEFDVEVHRDWAPLGADRLWNLVRIGFFDGGRFFRVVPDFVAQFGKSGDPAVNKQWYQMKIKDDPVRESNRIGYLTFATEGKDTRATQVFLNLKDNPDLDKRGFAPVGRVVKGLDVVKALYSGYGEAPDQGLLHFRGDIYLEESFPKLDKIRTATIVE